MNSKIYDDLLQSISKDNILINEPMKKHITFRVGGEADYLIMPSKEDELIHAVGVCRKYNTPYFIMGNGSNLLVSDQGYRGVIIQIYKQMSSVEVTGKLLYAQAGASLAKVAGAALESNLTGFEFAAGIPGTLGGACTMNAGAYGGEMKDVLIEVKVLDTNGDVQVIPVEKLELGYRTSIIARKGYVVLGASIRLQQGDRKAIKEKMEELKIQRVTKQPLEFASAGSTFKRPEGYFAGKLIQDAGLRGYMVGDAQVSEKHCGFVINRGSATAADIDELMKTVSYKVKEQFGVVLEPEVKRLGEF